MRACARACVRACVCVCVGGGGVRGIQYHIYVLFFRFYVDLLVDLVKRGALTFVREIRRYRNHRYYYHESKTNKQKPFKFVKVLTRWTVS